MDLAFPGIIMLLKLLFKLCLENKLDKISAVKSIISFPIDISFLALSFGSALYIGKSNTPNFKSDPKEMVVYLIAGIIVCGITTVLSKMADSNFVSVHNLSVTLQTIASYICAVVLLISAFYLVAP